MKNTLKSIGVTILILMVCIGLAVIAMYLTRNSPRSVSVSKDQFDSLVKSGTIASSETAASFGNSQNDGSDFDGTIYDSGYGSLVLGEVSNGNSITVTKDHLLVIGIKDGRSDDFVITHPITDRQANELQGAIKNSCQ